MLTRLPEIWEKEIINIHKNVDWVYETSMQLVKDFNMLNLSLEFEPEQNQSYSKLFNEATAIIQRLSEKDHQGLLHLLYRVDISENEMRAIVAMHPPPELYGKIAEALLKREFMKIVYRYKYSVG
jgi:hypothetical protein